MGSARLSTFDEPPRERFSYCFALADETATIVRVERDGADLTPGKLLDISATLRRLASTVDGFGEPTRVRE